MNSGGGDDGTEVGRRDKLSSVVGVSTSGVEAVAVRVLDMIEGSAVKSTIVTDSRR